MFEMFKGRSGKKAERLPPPNDEKIPTAVEATETVEGDTSPKFAKFRDLVMSSESGPAAHEVYQLLGGPEAIGTELNDGQKQTLRQVLLRIRKYNHGDYVVMNAGQKVTFMEAFKEQLAGMYREPVVPREFEALEAE
jgi:hypothetical protein